MTLIGIRRRSARKHGCHEKLVGADERESWRWMSGMNELVRRQFEFGETNKKALETGGNDAL